MNCEFNVLPDIEEGFIRGSIWKNIYSFYKYKGEKPKLKDNKESIDYMIQIYTFCLIELNEYLALNNNQEALTMKKRLQSELDKLTKYRESW